MRGATFYSVENVLIESTRLTLYHNVLPGSNLHFEKYCCPYCLDLAGGLYVYATVVIEIIAGFISCLLTLSQEVG